jgi:ATP-dependent exoDNAse (exonuclease V) alpha subunit
MDHVLNGKSVFITGGAGVGKTALVRSIAEKLAVDFAIVAPTGIAAANAGGVTIHRFLGLIPSDTESTHPQYVWRVVNRAAKNPNRPPPTLKAIFVDEISMVSGRLFSLMDMILRKFYDPKRPFGGIQMILVGCFFQLPPVPSRDDRERMVSTPDFAFNTEAWLKLHPIIVHLDEIVRQADVRMKECLNDLRVGRETDRLTEFIKEAEDRPLSEDDKEPPVFLFATNIAKDSENKRRLALLPVQEFVFVSEDSGDSSYLKDLLVPRVLVVKVGARVIALRNDGFDRFFNGSLGTILNIGQNEILILFDGYAEAVPVTRVHCEIRTVMSCNTVDGVVASRLQFPLDLAWATTVHKSQGLTLDKVCVDLSRVFSPGQMYVAISRARSPEGLWVRRWNGRVLRGYPEVERFYQDWGIAVSV